MEKKGWDKRELTDQVNQVTDITYEQIRRITKGEYPPSRMLLRVVCNLLGLNFKQLDDILSEDILRRKHGDVLLRMAGQNPELAPFERVWGRLSEGDKQGLIASAEAMAKRHA